MIRCIKLKDVDTSIEYENQRSASLIQDIKLGPIESSTTIDRVLYLRSPIASTRIVDLSIEASLTEATVDEDSTQQIEEIGHTLSIPISDPLDISSSVIYRHSSNATPEDGVEGWASVMSVVNVPGTRDLTIEDVSIEPRVSPGSLSRWTSALKLTWQNEVVECVSSSLSLAGPSKFPQSESQTLHPGSWTPVLKSIRMDVQYCIFDSVQVRPEAQSTSVYLDRAYKRAICRYCRYVEIVSSLCSSFTTTRVRAKTIRPDPEGAAITTRLPLPVLALPPQDSFITAHLTSPTYISQSQSHPLKMKLSISNSHPSATATSLFLTVDPNEQFNPVGPKAMRLAPLPPSQTALMEFEMVSVSNRTGMVTLPKVRLWEGEEDDREELDVMVLSDGGERVQMGGATVQILP